MQHKLRVLLATGAGAAVLAAGGIAVAETTTPSATTPTASSSSSTPSTGSSASGTAKAKHAKHDRSKDGASLRDAVRGQWVTRDAKTGTEVTHDYARGTVTSVSASAITIKEPDGTSATFAVTKDTKVFGKPAAKGQKPAASSISAVKTGDAVAVLGTGTGPFTATHVLDRGTPSATTTH